VATHATYPAITRKAAYALEVIF